MPRPIWLEKLTATQRAAILAKAFSIMKDFQAENNGAGGLALRQASEQVWALKSYYEQEAKK